MRRFLLAVPLLAVTAMLVASPALAVNKASHAGWMPITGMLLINKLDAPRPLDGRPGHDPFDGTDPTYKCDGQHHNTLCINHGESGFVSITDRECRHHYDCGGIEDNLVPDDIGHNELLGGAGNNTIHAGPRGDIIWGYYKAEGAPLNQINRLWGGEGNDFIYAGHGWNEIWTGGGRDEVHAHYGRGIIHCESPTVVVWLSHRSEPKYKLDGCTKLTYKSNAGADGNG